MINSDGEKLDKKFEGLLRRVLKNFPENMEITPETELEEAGLGSIQLIDILLSVEDTYDVIIPDDMLVRSTFSTPGDLWKAISSLSNDSTL